jgi:uncharacterized protein YifE (UPF0438 family)
MYPQGYSRNGDEMYHQGYSRNGDEMYPQGYSRNGDEIQHSPLHDTFQIKTEKR